MPDEKELDFEVTDAIKLKFYEVAKRIMWQDTFQLILKQAEYELRAGEIVSGKE